MYGPEVAFSLPARGGSDRFTLVAEARQLLLEELLHLLVAMGDGETNDEVAPPRREDPFRRGQHGERTFAAPFVVFEEVLDNVIAKLVGRDLCDVVDYVLMEASRPSSVPVF